MQKMVQMTASLVPRGAVFNLAVAHGDSPEELREIRVLAQQNMPGFLNFMDCTLGSYVGPHLLGVGVQMLDEAYSAVGSKN